MTKKIRRYQHTDANTLEDLLTIMAGNVEDALIESGVPAEEYTALKCFELAMPFALEVFRKNENMSYTVGWPSRTTD